MQEFRNPHLWGAGMRRKDLQRKQTPAGNTRRQCFPQGLSLYPEKPIRFAGAAARSADEPDAAW